MIKVCQHFLEKPDEKLPTHMYLEGYDLVYRCSIKRFSYDDLKVYLQSNFTKILVTAIDFIRANSNVYPRLSE